MNKLLNIKNFIFVGILAIAFNAEALPINSSTFLFGGQFMKHNSGVSHFATIPDFSNFTVPQQAFNRFRDPGGFDKTSFGLHRQGPRTYIEHITGLNPRPGRQYCEAGNLGVADCSDSTGHSLPIPEPATLLLLGVGLLGITRFTQSKS